MLYTLRFFFSSKCSLFHNSNAFGSCIIHILIQGVQKFKKYNSGRGSLTMLGIGVFGHYRCVGEPYTVHELCVSSVYLYIGLTLLGDLSPLLDGCLMSSRST